MKTARGSAGVLAQCLAALLDDEGDSIDRQAGIFVVAETILIWRRSMKGS